VTGPSAYVTVDEAHGVALVKGPAAEQLVYRLSPADFSWVPPVESQCPRLGRARGDRR
jgi:hypothetical protein